MSDFVTIAKVSEFSEGEVKTISVQNHDIALAKVEGKFYAFENTCPHRQGQLADGKLNGYTIVCPLHFWDFDIRSGISEYNPRDKVEVFEIRVEEDKVQVNTKKIPSEGPKTEYLQRWKRFKDPLEPSMGDIHKLAMGKKLVSPMGTKKKVIGFEDILFNPAQLASLPLLDNEEVDSTTIIGKNALQPLKLSMPVMVSHMSFGALSREAKIAFAKGTSAVGTAMGSGEGGMLPDAQQSAKNYIFEMASGYFGWNEENIKKAQAIEIKTGLGGLLPGKKSNRRNCKGSQCFSWKKCAKSK